MNEDYEKLFDSLHRTELLAGQNYEKLRAIQNDQEYIQMQLQEIHDILNEPTRTIIGYYIDKIIGLFRR